MSRDLRAISIWGQFHLIMLGSEKTVCGKTPDSGEPRASGWWPKHSEVCHACLEAA